MKFIEICSNINPLLERAPHYQDDLKTPGGSVKDWFKAMGVEADHIKEAMEAAKQLPSYKKLAGMFKVKGGDRLDKNGTFSFTTDKNTYSVYGNGVIRQEATRQGINHWITKLKAPKPALVHGSPVKSLIKIYDNAFKELASKNLKESVELTENVNFGKMQQAIYDYVIKNTKGIPPDAKNEAKGSDTFWVHEFDEAIKLFDDKDAPDNDEFASMSHQLWSGATYEDELVEALWNAIEAVSHKMIDYYSDSWNHPPGYKKVQLKVMKHPSEKDLLALAKVIDPTRK